jgi:hypothetical protein
MDENNICNLCNKTFASKQSLNVHKKTAKSCSGDVEKITYDCEYCSKQFASVKNLKYHTDICLIKKDKEIEDLMKIIEEDKIKYNTLSDSFYKKEEEFNLTLKQKEEDLKQVLKYKDETFNNVLEKTYYDFNEKLKSKDEEITKKLFDIKKLETVIEQLEKQLEKKEETSLKQIQELQNKIERLASRAIDKKTTTVNNNTTNNIEIHQPLPSKEKMVEIIRNKFNEKYLICGSKGVANFVSKEIILGENGELLYKCFDVSRKRFHYYNEDGEEVKDYNGYKLISMIHPEILKKSAQISHEAEREKNELKDKKCKTDQEVDRMCFLKTATETKIPECIAEIGCMKKNNSFSLELSRLISS